MCGGTRSPGNRTPSPGGPNTKASNSCGCRTSIEALTKPVFLYSIITQDAEADHTGGEGRPGVDDHTQPVVPHPQPPQALQPTDRPLHHPADLPQAAAVRRP